MNPLPADKGNAGPSRKKEKYAGIFAYGDSGATVKTGASARAWGAHIT